MTRPNGAGRSADERIVMRGSSGWWISGILAALFAYMLVDAAVRAEWSTILLALPWMCAILLVCWMLLIRPRLIITPSHLVVVNVLRMHTLPWPRIAELHVRYQLVITLTDGSVLRAWGSPTVHPQKTHAADRAQASRKRAFVGVVEAIDQARDELGRPADTGESPTVRVVWWPLLALVACVALGILSARLLA